MKNKILKNKIVKNKRKVLIAIIILSMVYFTKIKTYRLHIDESLVYNSGISIVHAYDGNKFGDGGIYGNQIADDDEIKRSVVDIVNNSKYKFKKITLLKNPYDYVYLSRTEYYRAEIMATADYNVGMIITTDNPKFSEISVTKPGGMFRIEYRFDKKSFENVNNRIKDYVDKIGY